MGHRAMAAFRDAEGSQNAVAAAQHETADRQFRAGRLFALANRAGYPACEVGKNDVAGLEHVALQAWSLLGAIRTEMDPAHDRSAQAEGGELVIGSSPAATTIAPTITPAIDQQVSGPPAIPCRVSVEE